MELFWLCNVLVMLPLFPLLHSLKDPFVLDGRDHPVSMCPPNLPLIDSPIPRPPDCPEDQDVNSTLVIPVLFMLFKTPASEVLQSVYYCSRLKVTITCYENLFGATQLTEVAGYGDVSPHQCKGYHISEPSYHLEAYSIIKGKKLAPVCQWLTTSVITYELLTLRKSQESVTPSPLAIHISSLGGIPCELARGHCNTGVGVAVWDIPSLQSTCRLRLQDSGIGVLRWDNTTKVMRVTSKSAKVMMTISSHIVYREPHCVDNMTYVYMSDEGSLVGIATRDQAQDIHQFLSQGDTQGVVGNISALRSNPHLETTFDLLSIEYELNRLRALTHSDIRELELDVCKAHVMRWNMAWGLRHISPETSVRLFTGDPHALGVIRGSRLMYSSCTQTHTWGLRARGRCGDTWRLLGDSPLCLESITMIATACPEQCSQEDTSFLLRLNTTHSVDLSVSPLMAFSHHTFYGARPSYTEPISIAGRPTFTLEELTGSTNVLHLYHSLAMRMGSVEVALAGNISTDHSSVSSMVGSPALYSSLGFAAGRVSSWGSGVWTLVSATVVVLWVIFMGYIITCCVKAARGLQKSTKSYGSLPQRSLYV